MLINTHDKKIHYTLRIASAMCLIGHGCFGILTKPIWCNYYALIGIDRQTAYHLMPVTGCLDILLGIVLLWKPVRVIAVWLVIWGLLTALCRPLSGEPFAEFIERAGNFGAPLALLLMSGGLSLNARWFFSPIDPLAPVSEKSGTRVRTTLGLIGFLLLAGHGWLNLLQKPSLLNQYVSLGFYHPVSLSLFLGIFEMVAALAILLKPARPLILIVLVWKLGSELFYPQFEILEWVERGGSYGTLLALWFCIPARHSDEPAKPAASKFAGRWSLVFWKGERRTAQL